MNKLSKEDQELVDILNESAQLAEQFPTTLENLKETEPDRDSFEEAAAFLGAAEVYLELLFNKREEYNELMERLGMLLFKKQPPFNELVDACFLHFTMLGNAFRILTLMYEEFADQMSECEEDMQMDYGAQDIWIGKKGAETMLRALNRLHESQKLLPEESELEEELIEALRDQEEDKGWSDTRPN